MSNTLAIGAVTATLQQILGDIAVPLPGDPAPDPDLADAFVTCKPLDIARADETKNQLNLFLFQMQANAAFRNTSGARDGESGAPPLALNLYYVLTGYGVGGDDVKAHRVLGRAMSLLHDNSTIPREALRIAMPACDLWQQIERVRIRPHPLSTDELSKLWTGFGKPYRVSVGYEVSVVLIESTRPATAALPVLSRGAPVGGVEPGPRVSPGLESRYPVLSSFECPLARPAMRLGEPVTFRGNQLGGTPLVARFAHPLRSAPHELAPSGARDASQFQVQVSGAPAAWPTGMYAVTVEVTSDQPRTTNTVAVPLAPRITSIAKLTSTPSLLVLEIGCAPHAWAEQKVSLIVGDRLVAAEPHGLTSTLQFRIADPPVGLTYLRLRIDGVDSLLVTDFTTSPPSFDSTQAVALP
ncbi:MAG: DUF4255 domain-containing protein [Kofleriaceae bacterium]